MSEEVKEKKQKKINDMLTEIGKNKATGLYDVLRLVVAFPLEANFNSDSKKVENALKEDEHVLARLSRSAWTSALETTARGASILSMLTMNLDKKRKEAAKKAEAKSRRTDGE